MNIGIFSKTYENCTLEETFQKLNKDGIYHTQFNFASTGLSPLPTTISEEIMEDIKSLSKKYGMTSEDFLKELGGLEVLKYDMTMRKAIDCMKESN